MAYKVRRFKEDIMSKKIVNVIKKVAIVAIGTAAIGSALWVRSHKVMLYTTGQNVIIRCKDNGKVIGVQASRDLLKKVNVSWQTIAGFVIKPGDKDFETLLSHIGEDAVEIQIQCR